MVTKEKYKSDNLVCVKRWTPDTTITDREPEQESVSVDFTQFWPFYNIGIFCVELPNFVNS